MDFLDKLILGKNTPLKSDSVNYPSRVYRNKSSKPEYRKIKCNTNINDSIIKDKSDTPSLPATNINDVIDDWRYWCLFLAEPLNREKAFKNYTNIIDDLRLAIWAKLLRSDTSQYIEVEVRQVEVSDINKIVERGDFLLKCVISKFRDYHEEEIFTVLRSVVDTHENIKNFVLLVDFTYHLVFMPLFDFSVFENIFKGLFGEYKLDEMFTLSATRKKDELKEDVKEDGTKMDVKEDESKMDEGEDVEEDESKMDDTNEEEKMDDTNKLISKFEYLVYKDPSSLYKTLDILLCCNATIHEVLQDDYTPTYRSPSKNIIKGETYFDFLLVQNENIKAQEIIKGDLMRIEKENEELRRKMG